MEQNNKNIVELPVARQPKTHMYSMALVFKADVEFLIPGIDLPDTDGLNLVAGNAAEIRMAQIVNFIPDEATLINYARIIQKGYSEAGEKHGFRLKNTRFERYDYFKMADIPCPVERPVQAPFTANISYDGNFLSVDDDTDEISQEPLSPDQIREMAMSRLIEVMDAANAANTASTPVKTKRVAADIHWGGIRDDLPRRMPIPDDVPEKDIPLWLAKSFGAVVHSYVMEYPDSKKPESDGDSHGE